MSDYKYPQKHRRVEVFAAKRTKSHREGETSYLIHITRRHPKGTKLWAYLRMLTSSEGNAEVGVGEEKYLIVINNREGVKKDDYVKMGDKLFQIVAPPDVFEDRGTEMKLTCVRVEPFAEPLVEDEE